MQFVRRVRAVWSWLPAFRAVAETEHLPTAASELNVVPSSLSRTVKLLEDELAVELFDRSGKTMALNDAGRGLLAAVRDAMRIVDEALVAAASGEALRGNVTAVACADFLELFVLKACARLARQHPEIVVGSFTVGTETVASLLVRGDADVAVVSEPPDHTELRVRELATLSRSVYAPRDRHGPLRFVGVKSQVGHLDDGWPPGLERDIVAWVGDERAALELAATASLATIAFDAVARSVPSAASLCALEEPPIGPRTSWLVHRRAVGTHRRTDALVDAICDVARSL